MTALAGHLYHPGRNTQNDFLLTPCLRLLLVETIHCREPGVDARLWALWTPGSVTKLHTHWTPTLPPKAPLPFPCGQRTATSHQHLPTQKDAFEIARLQTVTQSHKIKGQMIGSQRWFGDQSAADKACCESNQRGWGQSAL